MDAGKRNSDFQTCSLEPQCLWDRNCYFACGVDRIPEAQPTWKRFFAKMSAHPFSRVPTFSNALFPHYLPAKSFPARVPWREKIWQNAFRSGLNRTGEGGLECNGEGYSRGWEPVDRCDFHGTISAWFFSDSSRRDPIKGVADVFNFFLFLFFLFLLFFSFFGFFWYWKIFSRTRELLIVVSSI